MKIETKQWQFSRDLGKPPVTTGVKVNMPYEPQLFTESFGPPEQVKSGSGSLVFWNFRRGDNESGFCLFAKVPARGVSAPVEAHLARRGKLLSFAKFVVFRMIGVENAEEPPAFLGSGRFVISKIR